MLRNIPELNKKTLRPEIRKLIESNNIDFIGFQKFLYTKRYTTLRQFKRDVSAKSYIIPSTNSVNKTNFRIASNAFSNKNLDHTSNPLSIFNIYIMALWDMFESQIGLLIGESRNVHNKRMLSLEQKNEFIAIYEAISKSTNPSINGSINIYEKAIAKNQNLDDYIREEIQIVQQGFEKMKVDDHIQSLMIYYFIEPISRYYTLILFIPEVFDFLVRAEKDEYDKTLGSVYDGRIVEAFLMVFVTHSIFTLILLLDNNPNLANTTNEEELLIRVFLKIVIHFYVVQDATVGDATMLKMYDHVSKVAAKNSKLKDDVSKMNSTLMQRKSDVITMNGHKNNDREVVKAAKVLFIIWIVAFIFFLASSVCLLLIENYRSLLLQNSILVLALLVAMICSWVYKRFINRYPTMFL